MQGAYKLLSLKRGLTATHCNTQQHTATNCNTYGKVMQGAYKLLPPHMRPTHRCCLIVVCCSVLQCVAVCCSVLQCVAVCCSVLQCDAECCSSQKKHHESWRQLIVCCSVLHHVAVCCAVLQCVALCCTVMQSLALRQKKHHKSCDGVATMSRLLKIIGLSCRTQSLFQDSCAKENYNFKEPTNRSHLR